MIPWRTISSRSYIVSTLKVYILNLLLAWLCSQSHQWCCFPSFISFIILSESCQCYQSYVFSVLPLASLFLTLLGSVVLSPACSASTHLFFPNSIVAAPRLCFTYLWSTVWLSSWPRCMSPSGTLVGWGNWEGSCVFQSVLLVATAISTAK